MWTSYGKTMKIVVILDLLEKKNIYIYIYISSLCKNDKQSISICHV